MYVNRRLSSSRKALQISIVYRLIIVQHLIWSIECDQTNETSSQLAVELRTVDRPDLSTIKYSTEWIRGLGGKRNSIFFDHDLLSEKESNSMHSDRIGLLSKHSNTSVTNQSDLNGMSNLNILNGLRTFVVSNDLIRENESISSTVNSSSNYFYKNQLRRLRDVYSLDNSRGGGGGEDELYEIPVLLIIILTICYISISLSAIIGNLMILYIIRKKKKMQNSTNYLLANLSASDILMGRWFKLKFSTSSFFCGYDLII